MSSPSFDWICSLIRVMALVCYYMCQLLGAYRKWNVFLHICINFLLMYLENYLIIENRAKLLKLARERLGG
jgi:hypothetical protein